MSPEEVIGTADPMTLIIVLASVVALAGARMTLTRWQRNRLLEALSAHPRIELRDPGSSKAVFSAVIECEPEDPVSLTVLGSTVGLEWLLELPLPELPRDVEVGFDATSVVGEDDALVKALRDDEGVRRERGALFADTWEPQRITLADGRLILEARDRTGFSGVTVKRVVERAERLSRFSVAAALVLRRVRGELGEGQLCPMCKSVPLVPRAGELLEAACPNCRGRFLGPDAVRRLLVDEIGMAPGELKEAAAKGSKAPLVCPSCATRMSPVLLSDLIVDLCTGCDSLWLDEQELTLLSKGRYREVGL